MAGTLNKQPLSQQSCQLPYKGSLKPPLIGPFWPVRGSCTDAASRRDKHKPITTTRVILSRIVMPLAGGYRRGRPKGVPLRIVATFVTD